MSKKFNVLSCFDGMSCGQIALNRVGIEYENYFASEIDKNAIKVTQNNYPNTIQLGDITQIKGTNLPKIDLLIGGSPCQGFSFAGKQLNFQDPRSKLFFEFVRLKDELKPEYFLLENVMMKKEYQNVISKYLDVEPILIDSSLVSAQSRNRLYWTNIPVEDIPYKNIKLEDILDNNNETIISKDEKISRLRNTCNSDFFEYDVENNQVIFNALNNKKVYINLDIKPPFSFTETRTEDGKISRKIIRKLTGKDSTLRGKDYKLFIPKKTNSSKSNCIVTVKSPSDYIVDIDWNYRTYSIKELEKLQTLPDNYLKGMTLEQSRKLVGNGWTVDVIAHIFKSLKETNKIYKAKKLF